MELENGKIGNSQVTLLITGFILGTSIILLPDGAAKHDAWLSISLGMMEGILFALIYIFLGKRFPGKTMMQINDSVFGMYFGKLVSVIFLWYLIHIGSMATGNIKDFLSVTTMPRTPDLVFSILIVTICAYAITNGIEVIARCCQVLLPVALGSFFLVVFLLIKNINLQNLQPFMEVSLKDLLIAAHEAAIFPFGETAAFMMIIPFAAKEDKILVPVTKGILLGGTILTLAAIRNIGVLGESNGIYMYQNFQTERMIHIGNLLTRMEIISVIASVSMGFVKIAVFLYGAVLGGAQILRLRSYQPLIVPTAILMIILSQLNFANITANIVFNHKISPVYMLPFELGIPLLTFMVALLRGVPKQK